MTAERIRVLTADDHPFFRQGLRVVLDTTADLVIVGEAGTGDEVTLLTTELQPDVVLLDLQMPG